MRRLRLLLAGLIVPELRRTPMQVVVRADTSEAVATLEALRETIAHVATFAEERSVSCDLRIVLVSEVKR